MLKTWLSFAVWDYCPDNLSWHHDTRGGPAQEIGRQGKATPLCLDPILPPFAVLSLGPCHSFLIRCL